MDSALQQKIVPGARGVDRRAPGFGPSPGSAG